MYGVTTRGRCPLSLPEGPLNNPQNIYSLSTAQLYYVSTLNLPQIRGSFSFLPSSLCVSLSLALLPLGHLAIRRPEQAPALVRASFHLNGRPSHWRAQGPRLCGLANPLASPRGRDRASPPPSCAPPAKARESHHSLKSSHATEILKSNPRALTPLVLLVRLHPLLIDPSLLTSIPSLSLS